ncbi:flagellar motor protein MotB, partial [Cryobacterium sp. TMS1-13-1]
AAPQAAAPPEPPAPPPPDPPAPLPPAEPISDPWSGDWNTDDTNPKPF